MLLNIKIPFLAYFILLKIAFLPPITVSILFKVAKILKSILEVNSLFFTSTGRYTLI